MMTDGSPAGPASTESQALLLGVIRQHDLQIASLDSRTAALERSGPELASRYEARTAQLEAQQQRLSDHLAAQDRTSDQFSNEVRAHLASLLSAEQSRQTQAAEQGRQLEAARAEWRKSFYALLATAPGLVMLLATYLHASQTTTLASAGLAIVLPLLVLLVDWIRSGQRA